MKSNVAIMENRDVLAGIHEALELIEVPPTLFTGQHVAIKPNDTWASENDLTACTQADTVEAVITYVKRFNPRKITVTGGSGAAETEQVFKLLGIDKVIKQEEVEFFDHNKPPFKSVKLNYGPQKEIKVNPYILKYDTLISLAQLKVHHAAMVTLAMKNIAMSYPAADYYGHPRDKKLHSHNFFRDPQGFIAGMCQRFPIDLGIIVGHPAMIGTGPIGGRTFEADLTIASRDAVAADYIGARILGIEEVPHIMQAGTLGLGRASLDFIEFSGMGLESAIETFKLHSKAHSKSKRKSKIPLE